MAQVEVYTTQGGAWRWRIRNDDDSTQQVNTANDRSEAIAAARAAAGGERTELFDANGESYGFAVKPPSMRVVLLRSDGSLYGELDPAPSSGDGTPQIVTIDPTQTTDTSEQIDG